MTDVVTNILDEVHGLVESFQKQRKELLEKLKPNFHSIFLPFLSKYPEVTSIWFTAYAPYFNDGDACIFSVHDLYYDTEEEEEIGSWSNRELPIGKDFEALSNVMNSIPDDIIEDLFGSDIKVSITRDGVDVEEYDHS